MKIKFVANKCNRPKIEFCKSVLNKYTHRGKFSFFFDKQPTHCLTFFTILLLIKRANGIFVPHTRKFNL